MPVKIIDAGEAAAPVAPQSVPVAPTAPLGASAAMLKAGNALAFVTDRRGRRLGVKPTSALEVFELGPSLAAYSGAETSFNMALAAASVREIDGEPVSLPASLNQMRALIARLDFDGIGAAGKAFGAHGADMTDEEKAAAKN